MISCNNLCLRYPDGEKVNTIFEDINLIINKGENIILLGPSGSGKSSLIYLLSSLRKPTEGQVFYKDMELSACTDKQAADIRKKHFGLIFQTHFLLPYLTVLENTMIGNGCFSKINKEKAEELLCTLGLGEYKKRKLHQLSGGQRQRVAIARALINEPDIIFADEPTASLDHKTACEIMQILKNYRKDKILIMATHDTSILTGDEKVFQLMDGGITV